MKALIYISFLLAVVLMFGSCTVEKRLYRSGYHVEWKTSSQKQQPTGELKAERKGAKSFELDHQPALAENSPTASIEIDNSDLFADGGVVEEVMVNIVREQKERIHFDNKSDKAQFTQACETLWLTDGRQLQVKLLEINPTELKYKRCDYQEGPSVTVDRSEVNRVVYADGSVELIADTDTTVERKSSSSQNSKSGRRLEVVGLLSMIFGVFALFSFPFWPLFGLAALILSMVSFSKFRKNPGEFMGSGFAIAGITLALVSLVLFLGFWLIALIATA